MPSCYLNLHYATDIRMIITECHKRRCLDKLANIAEYQPLIYENVLMEEQQNEIFHCRLHIAVLVHESARGCY